MASRKTLGDYENELGEKITGVVRSIFNSARAGALLAVKCPCGNTFSTKKEVLVTRFKRGNNIMCRSCVNSANGEKGGRPKNV